MRTRSALPAIAVLAALLASACGSISLPTRGLHGVDPTPTLDRKLVTGKEPPVTLIAEDGTRCITSRDRFERTRIGSEVWCVWTGSGAAGGRATLLERQRIREVPRRTSPHVAGTGARQASDVR